MTNPTTAKLKARLKFARASLEEQEARRERLEERIALLEELRKPQRDLPQGTTILMATDEDIKNAVAHYATVDAALAAALHYNNMASRLAKEGSPELKEMHERLEAIYQERGDAIKNELDELVKERGYVPAEALVHFISKYAREGSSEWTDPQDLPARDGLEVRIAVAVSKLHTLSVYLMIHTLQLMTERQH